jgi:hypothetical protein
MSTDGDNTITAGDLRSLTSFVDSAWFTSEEQERQDLLVTKSAEWLVGATVDKKDHMTFEGKLSSV